MRWRCAEAVLAAGLTAAVGAAQDQTGRIEGTVIDAVARQPVRKAAVSIQAIGGAAASQGQLSVRGAYPGSTSTTTDASGSFAFENLAAGKYRISVTHQNYPESLLRRVAKTVEVSADDATENVTIELMPGGAISGHIVDEDGDPMTGCFVQLHSATSKQFAAPPPVMRDDGTYRLSGVAAGKYILSAQCSDEVFQPRPLSAGPDPPPTSAYPMQYYSGAGDAKSAQVVEVAAGTEKSGVDFQMHPVAVTHIHGTFAGGGADGRALGANLNVLLMPVEENHYDGFTFRGRAQVNEDGTFDIHEVFPGSYYLVASSPAAFLAGGAPQRANAASMVGGVMRVDVTDKPLNATLALHPAMDISGKVEIEGDAHRVTPGQIHLLLDPVVAGEGSMDTQAGEDGTFTFKGVLPGEWRIRLDAGGGVFLKSARLGGDDVKDGRLDLMSGTAGMLEVVASTKTATVAGTAPVGRFVFAQAEGDEPGQVQKVAPVDANGQFKIEGLAPGRYRFAVADDGAPMPDEGGQAVTVEEGETATVELKEQ
jgi:protocatechuate 3,4-dioxygenase beta subunit